ncbi:MAG: HAD-IIA family hydrolase [Clostridia bacterium]|nr:HAD-IIA family hydrolase [Clostridia bacterium]
MNEILKNKKLYIFDMDGTVYLEDTVFPFAVDFINKLRNSGRRILFFTNNASKNISVYFDKLNKMGFGVSKEEIMSSADVCTEFLNKYRNGKTVYLLGTPALEEHFISHKIPLVTDKQPDITVVSFDTTLTYEKLKNACTYIRNGAEFLSTHPDFNCPVKDGYIPDSGAICAAVTASTGVSPRYFGKPYPETADMICEITGVERADMCIFGDRLYTDIALGKANGITAVLVLTGEATLEDVENAPEESKPDFIYPSLAEVDKEIFN